MSNPRTTVLGGNTVTLVGPELKIGDRAPDFTLQATDLTNKTLADYGNALKLISVVPSLDTGICDAQTRRFNQEAESFDPNTLVLTISMDLPFAQARWCGAAGAERVIPLSDHAAADFGLKYGVLIEGLRLLNRAIFILDRDNMIRYLQIVADNGHPDYDAALDALKQLRD